MSLTIERIPRMNLSGAVDDLEAERQKLAADAALYLGYNKAAKGMDFKGSLAGVLRKLEIAPLVRSEVEKYKASKEGAGMWRNQKTALKLAAACLSLLFLSPITFARVSGSSFNLFDIAFPLQCIAAMILLVMFLFKVADIEDVYDSREVRVWESWSIKTFERNSGAIPEFALRKAVAIKKECPYADISIDQLVVRSEHGTRSRPDPDPFLVATLGNEKFYIEVWDERDFEKTL